jgi:hypothetical protein
LGFDESGGRWGIDTPVFGEIGRSFFDGLRRDLADPVAGIKRVDGAPDIYEFLADSLPTLYAEKSVLN